MPENQHNKSNNNLSNIRVIGILPWLELFGNERDNIEIYLSLREQGATVLVGISKNQIYSDVDIYLQKLGFETFGLPFGNQWSWMWLKQYPLSIFEKMNQLWNCSRILLQQIKTFKPTHIHISSFMGYNYIAPALFFSNVPLIYRVGEAAPTDSIYSLQIWRLAMKQSSTIVAVSEFVKQQILAQDIPKSKVKRIYNLAPSRLLTNHRTTQSDHQSINRQGFVYVGQISEQKGIRHLLKAVGKFPDYLLDIVGCSVNDTEFRKELEKWVKYHHLQDQVHFVGQVDDPTIFYAKSLIHIAPSIVREGLGMVVLEAKKVGTPSIVFPSGGLPEMVRHRIDGYVCRDKTPEALVEAIEWMLSDRDRLSKMGMAAIDDYETRFGRSRFLEEWSKVYLE